MTIRMIFSFDETGIFWKRELPNNYLQRREEGTKLQSTYCRSDSP
jgi:hypothetical protein